jgi:hypothetical protein
LAQRSQAQPLARRVAKPFADRHDLRADPERLDAIGKGAVFEEEDGRLDVAWNVAQKQLEANLRAADRVAGLIDNGEL